MSIDATGALSMQQRCAFSYVFAQQSLKVIHIFSSGLKHPRMKVRFTLFQIRQLSHSHNGKCTRFVLSPYHLPISCISQVIKPEPTFLVEARNHVPFWLAMTRISAFYFLFPSLFLRANSTRDHRYQTTHLYISVTFFMSDKQMTYVGFKSYASFYHPADIF